MPVGGYVSAGAYVWRNNRERDHFPACRGSKNLGGKMSFNTAMGCVIAMSFVVFGIALYLIHLKRKNKANHLG